MFPFGGGGGGGGGKEEEEILARDQRDHPTCTYSKSFSKSCSYSSEKGGLVCESARQIFRVCPNKPPFQILNSRKNDSSNEDSQTVSSSGTGSLFDLFKDLQEAINKSDGSQHPSQSQQKLPQKQKKKWSIADYDQEEANGGGGPSWRA